jgi:hypothetical protein
MPGGSTFPPMPKPADATPTGYQGGTYNNGYQPVGFSFYPYTGGYYPAPAYWYGQ